MLGAHSEVFFSFQQGAKHTNKQLSLNQMKHIYKCTQTQKFVLVIKISSIKHHIYILSNTYVYSLICSYNPCFVELTVFCWYIRYQLYYKFAIIIHALKCLTTALFFWLTIKEHWIFWWLLFFYISPSWHRIIYLQTILFWTHQKLPKSCKEKTRSKEYHNKSTQQSERKQLELKKVLRTQQPKPLN